jgi:hypothetical protein
LGKGSISPNCSGTGAGHAGKGGLAKECPSVIPGSSYDTKATDTMYEGSGGGGSQNSTKGSGGGMVWLSLLNHLRINNT